MADVTDLEVQMQNTNTYAKDTDTDTKPASQNPASLKIPVQDIVKVFRLSSTGKLQHIYLFCASESTMEKSNLAELFSDIEMATYDLQSVPISFSNYLIMKDDTIRTVKRKIVQEMIEHKGKGKDNDVQRIPSTDELYLFTSTPTELNMNDIYQTATENETVPLKQSVALQYAVNLNLDPFTSANEPIFPADTVSYPSWTKLTEPIVDFQKTGLHPVCQPLGMKFQHKRDFLFSANPYHVEKPVYTLSMNNPLFLFENDVLLNYGNTREIYVCLAQDVFEYALKQQLEEDYMSTIYFPLLYKRDIKTGAELAERAIELEEEILQTIQSGVKVRDEIVNIFHEIYWSSRSNSEIQYSERGIKSYNIVLKPSDFEHALPLELLFKNMHCSEDVPFIKYNPGSRRENMYRFYSKEISTNGKKIPVLSESVIMRLSRDTAKKTQISVYLRSPIAPTNKSGSFQEIFVEIEERSHIRIRGTLDAPMSHSELDTYLLNMVSPCIEKLNGFLQSSGYKLRNFTSISDNNVETSHFKYHILAPVNRKLNLSMLTGPLSAVFDVISTDISSEQGALLRYKRVENFRETDAQTAFITDISNRAEDPLAVIQALVDNYGMTRNAAITRFATYSSEHQQLNGKLIEQVGFPVVLKMEPFKPILRIEIREIVNSDYIESLQIYIDTLLRITQDPNSIAIDQERYKTFKSIKATDMNKINKKEVVVDNVIAAVGLPSVTEMYSIQPRRFGPIDDVVDEKEDKGLGTNEQVVPVDTLDDGEEGLMFDDDFEYDYDEDQEDQVGGEVSPTDSDHGEFTANIDGMSLRNPTPFFKKMKELDPKLFITEEVDPKYPLYSKVCQRRQPVILTDEEKNRIDKTNPGSYGKAIRYGSSPDKQHWYICPRYWCLKTNSSISKEDVDAGKCGKVIPSDSKKVPRGHYVYEFSNPKEHIDKEGNYIQHVPGFMKSATKHPDGLCLPCCFKDWNSPDQIKRREQCSQNAEQDNANKTGTQKPLVPQKMASYIMGEFTTPIPAQRWGFLPMSIQLFLRTDNSLATTIQDPAIIKPNVPVLLRYGVEQTTKQSFLGSVAHFYAYKHALKDTPSIADIRGILARSIDLDQFIRFQNGNLTGIFRPKVIDSVDTDRYAGTEFYKRINIQDEKQLDFLEDTIRSYENFVEFLQDENSVIDHTYLWDIVVDRNPKLMRDGINLIILRLDNDDGRDKVQMVCPTNAYTAVDYDPTKETVILLKREEFYEPIHLYEAKDNGNIIIKRAFLEHTALKPIKEMLALIQQTRKTFCPAQPSMPTVYKFKKNLPLLDILRVLKTHGYHVQSQIANYRNKMIGVRVTREEGQSPIYLPTFPSASVQGIQIENMDEDGFWLDYRSTRDRLQGIAKKTGIPCSPKIKIMEDGLIVGFLTETNQFVQISPPLQNLEDDGIELVKHVDYETNPTNQNNAKKTSVDITLARTKTEDADRVQTIRKIDMETQFYNVFRSLVRLQLNEYDQRILRQKMVDTIDDMGVLRINKLDKVVALLRELTTYSLSFQDVDIQTLDDLETIMMCDASSDGKCSTQRKYCLTVGEHTCQTVFPKRNFLSGSDNETLYFSRLADELIRYRRIRLFMFQPKTYLNISNTEFRIDDDEIFLLESLLNKDYFADMVSYNPNKHVQHIEYDNAAPSQTRVYDNRVSLDEQQKMIDTTKQGSNTVLKDYILDCIQRTSDHVIGNNKMGSWRPYFPPTTKEMVFGNSILCSFMAMIYILQDKYGKTDFSVQNVKTTLWKAYSKLEGLHKDKIVSILRNQGKRTLMDLVKRGTSTLEKVVVSDAYYITDLDWWVFCSSINLPVVLFSSTKLKYLMTATTTENTETNWLKLGGSGTDNYYFVRSAVNVQSNEPPRYHVLTPAIKFSQMQGQMFLEAERGDPKYAENMQSLDNYLARTRLIVRKPT
jgi:hypothetical protein